MLRLLTLECLQLNLLAVAAVIIIVVVVGGAIVAIALREYGGCRDRVLS
jgi:hypothetical protein